jgi:hypothetical protein
MSSFAPIVLAVGVVDERRIAGTAGVHVPWTQLGLPAPGDGRTFRAVFGRSDATFRRLDRASRALVLAGAAAGLPEVLPAGRAADTGIVVETTLGCLDADLRFAASMQAGMCDGPVFAYTLPSTGLGELALRHGLRGPTVCLSTTPAQRGVALREAALLLATGECDVVVAGLVDVLATPCEGVEPGCRTVLTVLASPRLSLPAVAPWPGEDAAAYERLLAAVMG